MAGFNSRYSPESTTGLNLPRYHTEDLFITPAEELFSNPLSHFPPSYHSGALSAPITMPGQSAHFGSAQNMYHSTSQASNQFYTPDESQQSYFTSKKIDTAITTPCPLPTQASAPTSSPHARHHDCTEIAFSTLSNLYSPLSYQPNATAFGGSSGLPTLDTVLAINKDAIEKVSVLLGCPCSTNPHYSTTVAFTIIKILAWYQAVVGMNSGSADEPFHTLLEAFTATPIALGAFQLEGEAEKRFREQLVLGELRRVEKLVDMFADRYCKSLDDKIDTAGVYGSLEMLLRSRLRDTVKMTLRDADEDAGMQWAQQEHMRERGNKIP
jgi:hypothetical protein